MRAVIAVFAALFCCCDEQHQHRGLRLRRALLRPRSRHGGKHQHRKHVLVKFRAFGWMAVQYCRLLVEAAARHERVDHHQRGLGLELRHHVALQCRHQPAAERTIPPRR